MKKRSKTLLIISLALILISMLVSGAVQTSFGKVDVKEISLVTGVGTLTGYLLVPDSATVDSQHRRSSPAMATSTTARCRISIMSNYHGAAMWSLP